MIRPPPESSLSDPLLPYPTLFRSGRCRTDREPLDHSGAQFQFGTLDARLGDIDQAIQRIEERIDDLGAQLLVLVVIIENAAIQRHFAIEQCGLEACFVIDQRFLRDGGILRERSGGDARETSRLVPFRNIGVEQERRSEEHTSELQSLMRISYAVFCLQKK